MAYKRTRKDFEADQQRKESPFVVYGTPLPPLDDESRDDGSYVPVWKQEVTDDRGRKRLHGAFTGGFSAGYFNTVGSKEGWTPATFVSSRTNRAKDSKKMTEQRPEDFMDEDDIREQEESKQISTGTDYSGFGTEHDPMHRDTLMDLFRPAEDSMGVKLLNKMGWKPGQGIGARVRRRIDSGDENSDLHLLAPEDVPMISFNKKNDFKGLGHDDGFGNTRAADSDTLTVRSADRMKVDDDDEEDKERPGLSFANRLKKQKKKLPRTGFGVGILNDTGSDEDDPYSMGPRISYNKVIGGDKKIKKKQPASIGTSNPLLKQKPIFVSKKLSSLKSTLRKCHDGRLPLAGFVLADELDSFSSISLMDENYKPPDVPPGWKPANADENQQNSLANDDNLNYQSTADAAKQSKHTSATRSNLLGEARLPGKSVFDFMTPAQREKLVKVTGKSNLPPALSEQLEGTSQSNSSSQVPEVDVPYLDGSTASAALSRSTSGGFMPYAEDLPKRERYKFFLELAAGQHPDGTMPLKPPSTTPRSSNSANRHDEAWQNELYEFVRAAEVFRPMTGAIASRFTTGSSSSTATILNTSEDSAEHDTLLRNPAKIVKPENPAEVAAKLGMFGIMTRSTSAFQPSRLVCKRFGVDMPDAAAVATFTPSYDEFQQQQERQRQQEHKMQRPLATPPTAAEHTSEPRHASADQAGSKGPSSLSTSAAVPASTSESGLATQVMIAETDEVGKLPSIVNPDTNDALERERPGQAVFRAIFGDSDSDSDSEGEGES